jgi:ketosteroid isomerase-like protein
MPDTAATESTVSRCFTAWTSRDTATVRELLAEDYAFEGPGMRVDGRDAFLAG